MSASSLSFRERVAVVGVAVWMGVLGLLLLPLMLLGFLVAAIVNIAAWPFSWLTAHVQGALERAFDRLMMTLLVAGLLFVAYKTVTAPVLWRHSDSDCVRALGVRGCL